MKRLFIILIAICIAFLSAGTALSLEADFTGEYYIEGIYNSNPNLAKTDLAVYYRQMRLRLQTDFKVTDDLKLTTRFDALEKIWNTDDSAFTNSEDAENIDFDRAYITAITKIGMFQLGRQEGVTWGTTWADDEDDTDRFKWVIPIDAAGGKLIFALIAEKTTENDKTRQDEDSTTDITSGKDNDKYYFGTIYKREKYDTGLLFGHYDFNRVQDPGQQDAVRRFGVQGTSPTAYGTQLAGYGAALVADGGVTPGANVLAFLTANPTFQTNYAALGAPVSSGGSASDPMNIIATRGPLTEAAVWLVSPYFRGKFDRLGIQAELDYVFGTLSYTDDGYTSPDRDAQAFSYFLEGTYDIGPVTVQAGWAHRSGDADDGDDKEKSMGYFAPGLDWEKMFILSSDYHGLNNLLGVDPVTGARIGNHVGDGYITYSRGLLDGFQMPYIGVDYAVRDDVTIGLLAAMSTADDTKTGWDDDQGIEVDGKLTWQIMDNLEYKLILAYLSTGDYWKGGVAANDPDDLFCAFSRLTMTF